MRIPCIIALGLGLAACGGPGADRAADQAGAEAASAMASAAVGGKVRIEDDRLRIEDGKGQLQLDTAGKGLERPDWWPQDVFLPGDGLIAQVGHNEGAQLLGVMLPQASAEAAEVIVRGMQERGWSTRRSSAGRDGTGMTTFAKDGRQVSVLVIPARQGQAGTLATYHLREGAAR